MTEGKQSELKSSQWDFEYEQQLSQVNGHHVLDDVQLTLDLNESDHSDDTNNNQHIRNIKNDDNNDNHSVYTFKSTKSIRSANSNKSDCDDFHNIFFSSTTNNNNNQSNKNTAITNPIKPKKKRKRRFEDMINDNQTISIHAISASHTNNNNSQISIHTISSSSTSSSNTSFQAIHTFSHSYCSNNKNKKRKTNINRNNTIPNKWRWDPHIFAGNNNVCFRVKGLYNPATIQVVTDEYFLVESHNPAPHRKTPLCFKFKYEDYIKDRFRVIPLNSASQLTQTQTQSQCIQQPPQIDTQQIVNNDCHILHEQEEEEGNEDIVTETVAERVKQRRRSHDNISADSNVFGIQSNHNKKRSLNGRRNRKRRKAKKRKKRLSDSESDNCNEDSDCKKEEDSDYNNKRKKSVKKSKKKYIGWTSGEEDALIAAYKKYRSYENAAMFEEGVFSKIMKDRKYSKIFKKNNRKRNTIKCKWFRLNQKYKITKKWDKEKKRKENNKSKEEDDGSDESEY